MNNKDIHNNKSIAETFNDYFIYVGPTLAANIPQSTRSFESYLKYNNLTQEEYIISDEEFETAFFSIKSNKSPGYDDISSNVIKEIYNYIQKPLKRIFSLSITKGIFPDDLKIAKVTPIYKAGEKTKVSNYRPISVLPCFSKKLKDLWI